jgi:hypothetical protein
MPTAPDPSFASWKLLARSVLMAATGLLPSPAAVSSQELAEAIGPAELRHAIEGIYARAEGEGPRGAFVNEIVSLADGRVRFRQTKAGVATDLVVGSGGGGAPQMRSGSLEGGPLPAFAAADPAMASFVRGHEIHRMLLDLDRRFRADARTAAEGCVALRGGDDLAVTVCRGGENGPPATIELELPAALSGGSTRIELSDWRKLHELRLPFGAVLLHAGERHTYRYTAVLPFRLSPGGALPAEPAALFDRLGDLAELAAAHERLLEAHRRSDVALFFADAAERSLDSGRGRLTDTGRDRLAARLGPYLAGIRFSRYEDVALPAVAVSADGSLGWLACQIEAAGSTRDPVPAPVAYGFSWVELYARNAGTGDRWQIVGNASSARP